MRATHPIRPYACRKIAVSLTRSRNRRLPRRCVAPLRHAPVTHTIQSTNRNPRKSTSSRILRRAPRCYHLKVPSPSLQGIVPALVTPFHPDERIDCSAWQRLIDRMISAGVDGLFVGGSSGEFYALDPEERAVTLRFCLQAAAGRVPLFANVGCITTRETVRLAVSAQSMGVDVIVVITPYYLKPTQDELADHYIEVCRAVRLPVLAYNFPQHGGVDLAPETLGRIAARCENMMGLKDSSGVLEQSVAYRTCAPGRELAVFIGPEHILLDAWQRGCHGAVTACANIAPRLFVDLWRASREGRREDARRLQALAAELGHAVGLHTFPGVLKEALQLAGFPAGVCRRPIGPMPEPALRQLAAVVDHLNKEGCLA
jgi:4-hydroxy-tetrahydrodipicolinate synthase